MHIDTYYVGYGAGLWILGSADVEPAQAGTEACQKR
jgi:hypothetical protein